MRIRRLQRHDDLPPRPAVFLVADGDLRVHRLINVHNQDIPDIRHQAVEILRLAIRNLHARLGLGQTGYGRAQVALDGFSSVALPICLVHDDDNFIRKSRGLRQHASGITTSQRKGEKHTQTK